MQRAAGLGKLGALVLWGLLAAGGARADAASSAGMPAGIEEALARREYEATRNARGLQAPNRAHNLRTYFEPAGIRVHDRTAAGSPELLRLTLAGVGRGGALAAVPAGEVVHEDARVEIRRPGLVEWFVNSDAGLEQGFTLDVRPEGVDGLALELALAGASASAQGEDLVFATKGRRLRYGALHVVDATGRVLPARFAPASARRVRIEVDDAGALYPVVVDPLLTETADTTLVSNVSNGNFGYGVAAAGDVNADGYGDIVVGSPFYDSGENNEGAAFVFHGSAGGVPGSSPASAAAVLESNQTDSRMGYSVAGAGDVNGDGYADVIIGAPGYDAGEGVNEGVAFLFHGGASGVQNGSPANAAARLEGDQATGFFGSGVAGAGDVNGDGYADVIIGASSYSIGSNNEGAAFVFHGGASGVGDGSAMSPDTKLESNHTGGSMGTGVAGAGDVNRDGYDDVIVGAPLYDVGGQSDEGAAFVFLGSGSGVADGDPGNAAARLESDQADAQLGTSVAGAGDVNGDGYADVIVGANLYDEGQTNEGAAFVFHGGSGGISNGTPASAAARIESNQSEARLGASVAGAGDVDGDGYADVIVGAAIYDADQTDEGAAFVFLGSGSGVASGSPLTAAAQLEASPAVAGMASTVASAGDVNGDGYADVVIGHPSYFGGASNEGAAFVYHGGAQGVVSGNVATAAAQLEANQLAAELGNSVAGAGDVNGDGYSDVIVGAPAYDAGVTDEGAAFLFHGGPSGIPDGSPVNAATQLDAANQIGARFGAAVAAAGDVNGDGYGDVIVGAPHYCDGGVCGGAAYVFHGGASGIDGTAAARVVGDQVAALLGVSLASAGDVNGDGYADVIVGAVYYDAGQTDEGAAFLFHGGPTGIGNGSAATADTRLESNQADAQFGWVVASAGDVNGDGYADVVVGATTYDAGETNEGAAFVFQGSASGIPNGNPVTAAAQLESDQVVSYFGISVAGAGDVNGDGYADVIIGAFHYADGQSQEGAAFVFHGGASGIADGDLASAATVLQSDQAEAFFGSSVASAGDVNGDGFGDVIVGAHNFDAGVTDAGAVFVFLGGSSGIPDGNPSTASAQLESDQGISWGDFFSIGSAGDVNGDGYADVIVGIFRYSSGQTEEGAAFLFYGNGNRTGRLLLPSQRRDEVSTLRVQPWGTSYLDTFAVTLREGNPQGRGRAKLELQWCPSGVPFGHASCGSALSPSWIETATYTLTASELADGALYRWRARQLFAPFRVTSAGITPPPNPAHGPWRRVYGQALEADLRVGLDTDLDGQRNSVDLDDDGDGIEDIEELGHGSDPLDPDSDDDGLNDGAELALGSLLLDPDYDDDGHCDGPNGVGAICTGGDNCPLVGNNDQTNGDAFTAGDACQCGDVTGDGLITTIDYLRAREIVIGRTPSGPDEVNRCDVTGDADCHVDDLAVLQRLVNGAPATIVYGCEVYTDQ